MPKLTDHQSDAYTKCLIMGDSGSGKTGGLASLVGAGYKLGILDFDNGLESLKNYIRKNHPAMLGNVEYRTLQDDRKATAEGFVLKGKAHAFIDAIKMLEHWKYDDVDLGNPADWGPEWIFVIDSLTFMADAAFDWRHQLVAGGKFDMRAVYGDAQNAIESVLGGLKSDNFKTNVIVISHVRYLEREDGLRKGYPTAVGSAISPIIPRYFNSVALCETKAGGKRTIQTAATTQIDLKNPRPFEMQPSYPLETGLAQFFGVLREAPKATTNLKRVK